MKVVVNVPKPRSEAARMLADRRYHHRVVRSKKAYTRKGRNSSRLQTSRTLFSPANLLG